jgi:DNA repair protein RecN (Recombination protein N)
VLKQLSIRNFALIESVDVAFGSGLNIITGETGAGKSIMVDALMLVLGERASADAVRHGEAKAIVEGVFSLQGNAGVAKLLKAHEYDGDDDELIIRREVAAKGTSRCFLNDSPAPVHLVKEIGDLLVDFHGQHEHQSILKTDSHIHMLDNVGGLDGIVEEFLKSYNELHDLQKSLKDLLKRESSLREQQDLRRFQLSEIEEIDPQPDEENELEAELAIIENSEHLHDATLQLHELLYENENSVRDQLVKARNLIEELAAIDKTFAEFVEEARGAIVTVEEIAKFAQNYNSRIEFQPQRIEFIRERLRLLQRLRKKYGSFEAIFENRAQFQEELQLADNFEKEIERLKTQIGEQQKVVGKHAQRLSLKRADVAKKVEKGIVATLATLGIPHATFKVMIAQEPVVFKNGSGDGVLKAEIDGKYFLAYPNGIDKVEFYISTNSGEEPKPIVRVASGGEISRVMLAMKSILAKSDRLPMLVFDEIDTGISGRISQKVGIAMKNLADFHQIITITHSPQIAALADVHISVVKHESKGKAHINVRPLAMNERMREVAKLLSGEDISEAALQSAQELMNVKAV